MMYHVAKKQIRLQEEIEITDVNNSYLYNRLKVKRKEEVILVSTGTHDSLEASQFVQILEKRQGMKVSY